MPDNSNLFSGKGKYLWGWLLFTFVAVIFVVFTIKGGNEFDFAKREILLRRIGHELLLQSGDSTSRVLPLKQLAGNEYQISFEHAFSFQPNFLVATTQRLLAQDPLTSDYIVNVLNCSNGSVAYGYAMSKNKKDDIVTCIGRTQPRACYKINIKFKPMGFTIIRYEYIFGALLLLAVGGFVFLRFVSQRNALPNAPNVPSLSGLSHNAHTDMFTFGAVLFDAQNQQLIIHEKTIELTGTETRLLRIFAQSCNEVIERSRLQKEIWEDEGVIVGRSLDMFISKLRKKMESDPTIKIAVIRGKGYKLETYA